MKEILLTQLLPHLADYIIATIVGLACMYFQRLTGLQVEAKHREAFQSALSNGAHLLLLPGGTIDDAIDYVLRSVPDALRHFDIHDREAIQEYLEPKILAQGAAVAKPDANRVSKVSATEAAAVMNGV